MKGFAVFFAVVLVLAVGPSVVTLDAQLNLGPWPMFRHDLSHTGRADNYNGPEEPGLAWSYFVGDGIISSPAIGSDGQIYIGSGLWDMTDRRIYALSSTGALLWSYDTGPPAGSFIPLSGVIASPSVGSDGRVYAGAFNGSFYALEPSGALAWSYMCPEAVGSSAAIGSNGEVYFGYGSPISSATGRFFCLEKDGGLSWSYRTKYGIGSSPAVASDGRIYVGNSDKKISCFSQTGSLVWSYQGDNVMISSPAIGEEGTRIYVGSFDNRLYALRAAGTLSWSYETAGDILSSPALGSDGAVYVGSGFAKKADKRIYALNPDGSLLWSYETAGTVVSSPSIGSDGTIYAGSGMSVLDFPEPTPAADKRIYALNPDGSLLWSYETGDGVASSPSIGPDGGLYFGSLDRAIYCLKVPPTPTPTPNYLELHVPEKDGGGYDFTQGQQVVLEWEVYPDRYAYTGVPCAVYLGAARGPVAEDQPVSVQEITSSEVLFLFDSKLKPSRYDPKNLKPTYSGVIFPLGGGTTSGVLPFTAPGGAAGRWVFAAAFVKLDGTGFPADPPVEVSNGFNLQ